jgi:putative hydrolase
VSAERWVGLAGDHHVHSTFSDDAESALAENIAAAKIVGLSELRLVDHVRASTTWVPEFLAAVAELVDADPLSDLGSGTRGRHVHPELLTVATGVEAKILDASGRLDLPADLVIGPGGVDRVLIADHQYPGPDGPWSPRRVLEERAAGLSAATVLDTLIGATISAMRSIDYAQLAHPFSLLPKVGLGEDDLHDDHLTALATAAASTGTLVEVNEKWACPGPRVIDALTMAGVTLVASTDSHHQRDVGRYSRVAELTAALPSAPPAGDASSARVAGRRG